MTKLDIAKKEGREKFEKKFLNHTNEFINPWKFSHPTPRHEDLTKLAEEFQSYTDSHERAIEIAQLEDLVEEAEGMEIKALHSEESFETESGNTLTEKSLRNGIKRLQNNSNMEHRTAFNSALTTLITKYQDRIKKLKS